MKRLQAEEDLVAAFLQEVLPKIERVISRALSEGRSLGELAVNLERSLDGKVRGGCAPREAVAKRWLDDPKVPVEAADAIATEVRETPPTEVPIVLAIETPRGDIVYGVKRLEGDVVAPN